MKSSNFKTHSISSKWPSRSFIWLLTDCLWYALLFKTCCPLQSCIGSVIVPFSRVKVWQYFILSTIFIVPVVLSWYSEIFFSFFFFPTCHLFYKIIIFDPHRYQMLLEVLLDGEDILIILSCLFVMRRRHLETWSRFYSRWGITSKFSLTVGKL